jgi:hypothetical protein
LIRSQALYPAELRARPRGKSSYYKGNPASTAFRKNPFFTFNLSVVCTGFAVHAGSGENPLLWKRFGEVPHPFSEGRQDRLYRTLLAQGDGKKSVDLLETKPERAVVAVIRSMGEIEDALSHL